MSEALQAYRHVAASDEFAVLERMRSKARHDEAQALNNARRQEREHWQVVVAEKDTKLAEKDTKLAEKDTKLAEKENTLAEQAALIAKLQAQLNKK